MKYWYEANYNVYKIYVLVAEYMFTFINISSFNVGILEEAMPHRISNYYFFSLMHPLCVDLAFGDTVNGDVFYRTYDGVLNLDWINCDIYHFDSTSYYDKHVIITKTGSEIDDIYNGILGICPNMKENENIKGSKDSYVSFIERFLYKKSSVLITKYNKAIRYDVDNNKNKNIRKYNYTMDINFNYSIDDLNMIQNITKFQFNMSDYSPYWELEFYSFVLNNVEYSLMKDGKLYKIYLSYETKHIILPNEYKTAFEKNGAYFTVTKENKFGRKYDLLCDKKIKKGSKELKLVLKNYKFTENVEGVINVDDEKFNIIFSDINYIVISSYILRNFYVVLDKYNGHVILFKNTTYNSNNDNNNGNLLGDIIVFVKSHILSVFIFLLSVLILFILVLLLRKNNNKDQALIDLKKEIELLNTKR